MRITKFDPNHHNCSNCIAWMKAPGMISNGRPMGQCRLRSSPPITQLINIVHHYESKMQFQAGLKSAPEVSSQVTSQVLNGFPMRLDTDWCLEHELKVDA